MTGLADAGPDWTLTHNELVRDGFAWVGVSAQQVGVNAAKNGIPALGIKGDPVRYAELSHPGDRFSYDIFSQAGQAIRDHAALDIWRLETAQAVGGRESQSAGGWSPISTRYNRWSASTTASLLFWRCADEKFGVAPDVR